MCSQIGLLLCSSLAHSDEVYANSVFGEGASFESAEVLLRRESVNMEFQLAERIPELLVSE